MSPYDSAFVFGTMMLYAGTAGWIAMAFFTGFVASEKRRCTSCWFIGGLLFGPIALVAVVGVPDKSDHYLRPSPKTHIKCPDCKEPVLKEARVCKHCGCRLIPDSERN